MEFYTHGVQRSRQLAVKKEEHRIQSSSEKWLYKMASLFWLENNNHSILNRWVPAVKSFTEWYFVWANFSHGKLTGGTSAMRLVPAGDL